MALKLSASARLSMNSLSEPYSDIATHAQCFAGNFVFGSKCDGRKCLSANRISKSLVVDALVEQDLRNTFFLWCLFGVFKHARIHELPKSRLLGRRLDRRSDSPQ